MVAWIGYGILAAAVAYILGSVPTGYWLGRLLKGIDIRHHGSGSTGATNVLRTLGRGPAAVALSAWRPSLSRVGCSLCPPSVHLLRLILPRKHRAHGRWR